MDKDLNKFAMRMREWYSWHFPELARPAYPPLERASVAVAHGAELQGNSKTVPCNLTRGVAFCL